jgi:hypothetical protein
MRNYIDFIWKHCKHENTDRSSVDSTAVPRISTHLMMAEWASDEFYKKIEFLILILSLGGRVNNLK